MTVSNTRPVTAALAAVLAVAACAGGHHGEVRPSPEPVARGASESSAAVRADSARHPYTTADVRFMSSMIGHHAQALVMAGWAPTHGASSSVRTLAARIINGQQDEIATMQRWLLDRGQPLPEAHHSRMKMTDGAEHHGLMPGMLTAAQMRQLDGARGKEFDRLFLTFMIQHHSGAVTMVEELFATHGAAQEESVFKFANDAQVDQSTEIARMRRMLTALQSEEPSQ